jgi:transposase InsO family protein
VIHYLGTGLVIERHNIVYAYLRRSNSRIYFEEIKKGEIFEIEESVFHIERESGQLRIIKSRSSDVEVDVDKSDESEVNDLSTFSEKNQEKVLRAHGYVKGIERRGITRGDIPLIKEAIPEIAQEIKDPHPPSARSVSSWAVRYQKSQGDLISLLDGRSIKRMYASIDQENENLIEEAIDSIFMTLKRNSVREAFSGYCISVKKRNVQLTAVGLPKIKLVAVRTFYRRVNARNKKEVAIARFGKAHANNVFRMIKGHLPATRPLDYVEIDNTVVDLYVIDDNINLPLGRPILYVVKDRFSGMVLGFFATFSGPSAEGALTAIANSFKSREEIRRRFPSIKNDWPLAGPATVYVTDNGTDFQSIAFKRGIAELGSIQEFCAVRTPWHKASVESFFKDFNQTLLESLPGKTFSNVLKRYDYQPERDAVVRFSVFVELLYKWAIDYHNQRPHSRKHLSPYQQWVDGMKDLPLPLPPNPRTIDLMIGEINSCKASQEGIRFSNLFYSSSELIELYQAIRPKEFEFKVRRQDLGTVYVRDPRHHKYIEAVCTRLDYAHGLSMVQHKMITAFNRERGRKSNSVDALLQSREELAQVLSDDLQKSKKVSVKASRFVGISTETVLAGETASVFVIPNGVGSTANDVSEDALFDEVQSYPVTNIERR